MSAWMFGSDGMDRVMAAIDYAAKNGAPVPLRFLIPPDMVGRKLLEMNAEALRQRYDDDNDTSYKHTPVEISLMQMCKTLHCFRYQCSEGDVPETQLYKDVMTIEEWFDEHTGPDTSENRKAYDACIWG